VSVSIHGDLAYALNVDPTLTPQFTSTPGQVAFSPDGRQLVVTTKANGNDVDVFGPTAGGGLSATPVVNSEPGTVPFAITFDPAGNLVSGRVTEDDLTDEMRAEFVELYRRWQHDRDAWERP
jgi:DNA-binding beta-propeller fold protein YncE